MNYYRDPYLTTSIMESKAVFFFVAHVFFRIGVILET